MADTSYTLETGWRDMPLVEFCWLMWAHSVWLWIHAVPGRNMMWVVMRITAPTTQLFMQPEEYITLEAKKTGAWLTTFCPSTLVSFQCWDRSDWHNHYFLRKTSSGCWSNLGGCSFNILPTSCTKLSLPNMIIHMIMLKQEVQPKLGLLKWMTNFVLHEAGEVLKCWKRSVMQCMQPLVSLFINMMCHYRLGFILLQAWIIFSGLSLTVARCKATDQLTKDHIIMFLEGIVLLASCAKHMGELCIFSGVIACAQTLGCTPTQFSCAMPIMTFFYLLSLSHWPVNTFTSFCCQDPPALSSAVAHSTRMEASLCTERILRRSNVPAASE